MHAGQPLPWTLPPPLSRPQVALRSWQVEAPTSRPPAARPPVATSWPAPRSILVVMGLQEGPGARRGLQTPSPQSSPGRPRPPDTPGLQRTSSHPTLSSQGHWGCRTQHGGGTPPACRAWPPCSAPRPPEEPLPLWALGTWPWGPCPGDLTLGTSPWGGQLPHLWALLLFAQGTSPELQQRPRLRRGGRGASHASVLRRGCERRVGGLGPRVPGRRGPGLPFACERPEPPRIPWLRGHGHGPGGVRTL